MRPAALLDLTTELLRRVLRFEQPADAIVSAFFREHRALGQRERHALAETVYAVLRERLLFMQLAAGGHGALERRLALLGWCGDANLLRSALTPGEADWLAAASRVERAGLPDELRHNLPGWLAEALREQDPEGFWPLVDALNRPAPLDLRVNALRMKRKDAAAALAGAGITARPTPYSPWGLRVDGKPALTRQALFADGTIEVQDEGSQLVALLVDAHRGEMVVDFCAGAGGKTLALGAAMRNSGRLYAFDVSAARLAALRPRLERSGLDNVHVVQIAHERDERVERLAGKIDRVLVDAPCSGLGTLRRNPDLKWRQSPASVAELGQRQRAILDAAARLAKPGGRLVYATCSVLADENEAVAEAFTAAQARHFEVLPAAQALAAARVPDAATLVDGPYLRLLPQRHGTDGFFAAAWRRR